MLYLKKNEEHEIIFKDRKYMYWLYTRLIWAQLPSSTVCPKRIYNDLDCSLLHFFFRDGKIS